MTIRPFFKSGEGLFKEKESLELDFKPSKGDVLFIDGSRYEIILVEYVASVNGKQSISVFLVPASATIA